MKTSTSLLILAALCLGLGFDYIIAGGAIFWSFVLVALAWGNAQ